VDVRSLRLYRCYYSTLCQWCLGLTIAVVLLLAFVERPSSLSLSSDPRRRSTHLNPPCGATESVELVCLVVFALDLAVKSYLIGWDEFRKNKWLIGYLVVISVSVIDWMLSVSMMCDERLRVRRLLRPFFLLQNSSLMKKTLKCIKRTLPEIASVILLLALHLCLFTMIGMLLFAKTEDPEKNEEWNLHFRNLPTALTSLLVLLTTANNPDVMLPAYSLNRSYEPTVLMNLLTAIIYNQFRGYLLMSVQTSIIRRRLGIRAAFQVLSCLGDQTHPPVPQYNSQLLQRLQQIFSHYYLTILGNLVALANVLCIGAVLVLNADKSVADRDNVVMQIINLCFILFYLFEMSNIFDGFLTVLLLVTPLLHRVCVLSLWDMISFINMLIVFPDGCVRAFGRTAVSSCLWVSSVPSGLIRIFWSIFLVLDSLLSNQTQENGTSNFSSECGTYEQLGYWPNNFDDFAASIILLYDVMIVNNWQAFLDAYSRYTTGWSKIYFVCWWLTSSVMWVNLFVALILEVSSPVNQLNQVNQ
uniref:Two pore segment channel 2 n=1 Tax=Takifugu rubripes TaxID=31033 RepID=A0A674P2N2_TAKRU